MKTDYVEYLKRKALSVKGLNFQKILLKDGCISQKEYNRITKKIISYNKTIALR